jgi:hypothetical protein
MRHFGSKSEYSLGAPTRGTCPQIRKNRGRPAIERFLRPASVVQIPRAQELKFDIKGDGKFDAPSTAALAL